MLALKILKWLCPDHLYEEIEGDLIQKFNRERKIFSERKAKRRLLWNTLRFFRPGIILRNKFSFELNQLYMIQSYFKTAWRHLVRSKFLTLINVSGLAVGIAVFFFMAQYMSYEMSFDQFHNNGDKIYRIGLTRPASGENVSSARTFAGIRSLLKDNFTEVENYTAFYKTPANTGFLFRYKDKIYNEPGGILNADSAFFSVFPTLLAEGDFTSVLSSDHNLVISESMARKIFGDANPIGQTLERVDDYDKGTDFMITGVLKDIPQNSHIHANFIRHINDTRPDTEYWNEGLLFTYATLKKESDPELIATRINALLQKLEKDNPVIKGSSVILQPLTDIHLNSHFSDELEVNGNKTMLFILIGIGIVILVMAWINYLNLETSRFILRSGEISIRRIIGSGKSDLALQFLVEYICITILALLLAAFIIFLSAPYFSTLTEVPVTNLNFIHYKIWLMAFGVFIVGSAFVGSYPAFFLLNIKSLTIRKGGQAHGNSLRRVLVGVQFAASIVLIACVFMISNQLDFMRAANTKFDHSHVIALRNATAYSNQELSSVYGSFKTFEQRLLQSPNVQAVANSSAVPGTEIGFSYVNLIKRNRDEAYDPMIYKTLFINDTYIETFGLTLLAGRNFQSVNESKQWVEPWLDKNWRTIILNESAVKQLGFDSPEKAINQFVDFKIFDAFEKYEIIGVIADYHHEAVKKEVFPTIFANNYNTFQNVYYSVKFSANTNPEESLALLKKAWKEVYPESPFEYFFLDTYYDQQFKSEIHFKGIYSLLASIAIFIASMGILGITAFEVTRRLKEISIRKILGASAVNLLLLLSTSHLRIILIATIVACPVFYLLANHWLASYPLRISISPLFIIIPFVGVATLVVIISILQTLKTVVANPIDHIKNQ